ncbi:MAG: hypothetical protein MR842_02615 [Clostridiales bacterium]|nr:hypothetical protein [Clostridiales bacterium]MDO4349068.1 hypothetical protein [Eubacteriales bacterium]MDY4009560.1 hypothetical protein [Candidatus Limiplasma sp.]
MKLVKCPRCELNYIQETEKFCKVCLREMKGTQAEDDMELCSVCNAAPALPGRDVCLSCLKEMNGNGGDLGDDEGAPIVDESAIGLNSVSTMDEIIPQIHEELSENEFDGMEGELSLESVIEDEESDEDDGEEEQDD